MKNFKCVVSYDGSKFNGWQIQSNCRSVQEEIELAIFKIAKQEIKIIGAGRTDKGVHAKGQVFNFKTDLRLNSKEWKRAINAYLPNDIYLKNVSKISEDFHSRFSSHSKTYTYLLSTLEYNPIEANYIYQFGRKLDMDAMSEASKLFVGHHDFEHFCSNSLEEVNSFEKDIYSFEIAKRKGIIKFKINGSGFLRYQIRMMVGTLIEIGLHRKDVNYIIERLDKKGATTTSFNAPSCGLYLESVDY